MAVGKLLAYAALGTVVLFVGIALASDDSSTGEAAAPAAASKVAHASKSKKKAAVTRADFKTRRDWDAFKSCRHWARTGEYGIDDLDGILNYWAQQNSFTAQQLNTAKAACLWGWFEGGGK
jgi:hypothetical protein